MVFRHLCVVCLIAICGCASTVYKVDLRPDGRAMTRTLSLMGVTDDSSTPASITGDEERRLGKLYAAGQTDRDAGNIRFTATFTGKMPADVGGSGSLDFFDTSLGSLSIYAERFRGEDDLTASMADRRAAVDEVVDLLVGWIDAAFEDSQRETLHEFVDTNLRNDFQNVAMYVWTASAITGEIGNDGAEKQAWMPLFRVAQYLVERGYFAVADIPKISRMFAAGDADALMEFARNALVRKTNSAADAFDLLASRTATHASMVKFLKTTPQYEAYLREHKKSGSTKDANPMAVLATPLFQLLPVLTSNHETIDVTLHLPIKPFVTNGEWDEADGEVRWVREMGSSVLPVFAHATWAQPDVEEQTRLFGRVLITGRDLSEYAMWLHSLNELETKQWNGMLGTLDAADGIDNVIETLRMFNFADQPDCTDQPDFADTITGKWIAKLEKAPSASDD